ncbi:hypothetical protein ACLKA6_004604 [Drosophila palustris]
MQRVRGISSSRVTVAIGTYQLDRRNQKIQKTRSTLPRAVVGLAKDSPGLHKRRKIEHFVVQAGWKGCQEARHTIYASAAAYLTQQQASGNWKNCH